MELHKKIKELRLLKGLTQTQVAEKIDMLQSNYTLVESGKRNLKRDKIEKLAELFEVSVSELLHLETTTEKTQTQENTNDERLQELEKENENLKKEVENLTGKLNAILFKNIELLENKNLLEEKIRSYRKKTENYMFDLAYDDIFSYPFNIDYIEEIENGTEIKNIKDFFEYLFENNSDYAFVKELELFGYDKNNLNIFISFMEKFIKNYLSIWNEDDLFRLIPENTEKRKVFLNESLIKYETKRYHNINSERFNWEFLFDEKNFLYNWWFDFLEEEIEKVKEKYRKQKKNKK